MDDLYLVLGIEPDEKPEAIQEKFRFLAQAYHPDKFSSQKQKLLAEEEFKKINNAYQILSNPRKRAEYDLQRTGYSSNSSNYANNASRKAEEARAQQGEQEERYRREAEEKARQKLEEEKNWRAVEERKRTEKERGEKAAGSLNWYVGRPIGIAIVSVIFIIFILFIIFQSVSLSTSNTANTLTPTFEYPTLTSNQLRVQESAKIKNFPTRFLFDDFSDEKTYDNWQFDTFNDNSPQVDISNGKSIIKVSNDTVIFYMPVNYADVIVQVDITKINGDGLSLAGLVCRMEKVPEKLPNIYYFGISDKGEFIANNIYNSEVEATPMEGATLDNALSSLSLQKKSSYTLTVKCEGNTFSVYINETLVNFSEVNKNLVSSGYVGIILTSEKETEYSFDNFSISKP